MAVRQSESSRERRTRRLRYGIPPLVFVVPAGLLVRKIYRQQGTLSVKALVAAGLVCVAVVCDVAFLLINIHHLY
jgi:hypothetical protein